MNVKRILLIGLVLVAVVASLSFVAADTSVKVGGIDFSIPDGFTENDTFLEEGKSINYTGDDNNIPAKRSYKEFDKGDSGIDITVFEFNSPDDAKKAQDIDKKFFNATNRTLNGHDGIYVEDATVYHGFGYCKDNKYILITADTESLLEKAIPK